VPAVYPTPAHQQRAPAPPQRQPVGAEWTGLARQLHRRITKAYPDAEAHREALIAPFRPRPGFQPIPKHTHLKRLANKLRAPSLCRLRAVARFEPGELRVVEVWSIPARLEHETWTEDEPALALLLRAVTINPPAFAESNVRFAGIGLHALSRRYQRGAPRTDRAVLADLLALARGYPAAVAAGGEFAIPAAAGCWIGAVAPGAAVAIVRTFVGND